MGSYPAAIYVDEAGNIYGAKDTDQRGRRESQNRTVDGEPVEFAGRWFGSQMSYKPFKKACKEAQGRAYTRKHPLMRLAEYSDDCG